MPKKEKHTMSLPLSHTSPITFLMWNSHGLLLDLIILYLSSLLSLQECSITSLLC
ncbi:hypothetical protein PAXRUDRAFT_21274 [Paxillus rubicundulus Ve08.2h10]|uniref:Unplaced genomic scaffold scaffold_5323, whole genome shotgun sequence n=1 Tax=Paxillus rubicundulus Ve08.2h10 TaxID=930991 RepID=A0A0D0CZX2_9AGAM|nr:hypothetical protein PAXRUDRAFT_21274 [Paxillus rubicundulus Ve08.2h10]